MDKRHPPATEEELVHANADLFNEVEPETPEEIDAVLREGGHDPDSIAARMKSIAECALARSPLNWRNRAQLGLEQLSCLSRGSAFNRQTPPGVAKVYGVSPWR